MWSMTLPLVTRNRQSPFILPRTGLSLGRPTRLLRPIFRPYLERLEDRSLLSIFLVTNTNDSGPGSFPQAVLDANAATGTAANPDQICFNIPATDPGHVYYRNDHVGGGHVSQTNIAVTTATDDRTLADFDPDPDWPHSWWSIQLHGFQRADTVFITDTVVLDGYTQPGASPNTLAVGDNAVLKIVLDGAQGLVGENGVTIRGGGCTVRGLVFNHFLDTALNLHGSGNNLVVGNFIGTDVSGTSAAGGYDPGGGLGMWTTSPGNRIGGTSPGDRNIISGNFEAIIIGDGDGNLVQGKYIGTHKSGTTALGNGRGFEIWSSNDNTIGGTASGAGNTIAYSDYGVLVTAGTGQSIRGNSIFSNGIAGIDLAFDPSDSTNGVTDNDAAGHSGPNNFQNFPVLTAAESSSARTLITGTFNSGPLNGQPFEPNTTLTLDFYANSTRGHILEGRYYGEGETYLGSTTVFADANGDASFTAVAAGNLTGKYITATATDPNGSTSEFSAAVPVTEDSGSDQTFQESLQAALPRSATGPNAVIIRATNQAVADAFMAVFASSNLSPLSGPPGTATPISIQMNFDSSISIYEGNLSVPAVFRVQINGVTWYGGSPALTLASGDLTITGATFVNGSDAPTVLVAGGHLTLRNSTIQESTGYSRAAVEITGGAVDLGTTTDPGGNTLNVNGAGAFVLNATGNPVAAEGVTFLVNGVVLAPASLSGIVFEDFNDDGQVDFGERGLAGVAVTLAGTDFLGHAVSQSLVTDADGAYVFANLRPGAYRLTESQPAGFGQGTDSVGTAGGVLSATDLFFVRLAQDASGVNGLNYNFGERPAATGPIRSGQTAGIGFWNNGKGQALIRALPVVRNADGTVTSVANWLAATLPNLFGVNAGSNNLTGKSNAYVASLFQQDFLVHGVKLDAQVLATALSVYVTNDTLAGDTAVAYGFRVTTDGVGTASVNVDSSGDAFGVANNTTLTIFDLLLATDDQAVNGLLHGGNATKRKEANDVFSAINQAGGI